MRRLYESLAPGALVGLLWASGCSRAHADTTAEANGVHLMHAMVRAAAPDTKTAQDPQAATEEPEGGRACPAGMILVEGEYCPQVEHECLRWIDPPTDRYAYFRCAEYKKPATCRGARVHKRFCIDEAERTEPGSDLPLNGKSWTQATNICKAADARLCMTSEWNFACEGEEMRPYPYGWKRDSEVCNVDIARGLGKVGQLTDHRKPASAHPDCKSAFGVHDMAGNVDEWTTIDHAAPGTREVMKGSWWMPGKHHCRAFQGGHGAFYGGTETGVRCCKDARDPVVVATGTR